MHHICKEPSDGTWWALQSVKATHITWFTSQRESSFKVSGSLFSTYSLFPSKAQTSLASRNTIPHSLSPLWCVLRVPTVLFLESHWGCVTPLCKNTYTVHVAYGPQMVSPCDGSACHHYPGTFSRAHQAATAGDYSSRFPWLVPNHLLKVLFIIHYKPRILEFLPFSKNSIHLYLTPNMYTV